MDPDIAGRRVGEINPQLFPRDWPGDDECILLIVTSIVNTTIVSIVNAAIAGQPEPSQIIRELWGYQEEPIGDGGPHAHDVTPICDNNTSA